MSKVKLASRSWYRTIGRAVELLQQEAFPSALMEAFQSIFTFDASAILIYPKDSFPRLIHEQDITGHIEVEGEMRYYLDGIYLLDPFYVKAMKGPVRGLYTLRELVPDHFYRSEFYQRHFSLLHHKDEINYFLTVTGLGTIAISIGCARRFSASELERFRAIEPLVLSLMKRHWSHPANEILSSSKQISMHQKLTASFENFGRSILSGREYDVTQMILKGHSAKSAAIKLNISHETVKVHRKSIYSKLGLKSQSELFSLFIQSISDE